jgi:3',5'-cyclic-AMP phosphodiesterase
VTATVLQLTDTHMRADERPVYGHSPEQRLRLVLAACARKLPKIDLVVLTGDQSDDGELEAQRRVKAIVEEELQAPIIAIPGNHDSVAGDRPAFGPDPPVELGAWRVIGLDSSVPGEIHGALDVSAVERLLDALDHRPTMIALHHPPVPPSSHPWFQLDGAKELLASLAVRPHVRALISGHVHTPVTLTRGELALMGAPSTLAAFVFQGDGLPVTADGPVGARVIRLSADGSLDSALIDV